MDISLPATLFFTALMVALSLPMAIAVGLRRAETGIQLLHGDDEELLRRMRAHGNYIEYVPLALLALAGAELSGAPRWFLLACGTCLLLARLVHYASLRRRPDGRGRAVGAGLTTLIMAVLCGTILYHLWLAASFF